MKKLLGIVVLGLLWCNFGFAEQTSMQGNLVTSWGTKSGYVYINAHNKHSSKSIIIEKINIWFNHCADVNTSSTPDRVYSMYGKVYPMSDKKITTSVNFTRSGDMCATINKKWYVPSTTTYTPTKKKKSGAKKLLEKIIGD